MTCRELNDLLGDYLDRELAPADRGRLEAHLVDCATCAAYVRSYLETVRAVKATGEALDETLAADAPAELVEAILGTTVRGAASRPRGR